MKKLNLILLALTTLTVLSCNNKVDLYSEKGDHTIVYMMLNSHADTNFAKITKSFVGNANVLAYDYNANNYAPGELKEVYLMKEGNTSHIKMDTVSKWIPYNPNAQFYSGCYQTYYYTKNKLAAGKSYKLVIERSDGVTVSSTAKTINDFNITSPVETGQLNIDASNGTVVWEDKSGGVQTNASFFEVMAYFCYKEVMPGSTDTTSREIEWFLGEGQASKLFNSTDYNYSIRYKPSALYGIIENDKYLQNNSPYGVKRYIQKVRFEVTAIGEEMYNYLLINNSSSAIQDAPEYSNIENGYGLMSSRVTNSLRIVIKEVSKKKIVSEFPDYGFVYEPNQTTD